MKVLITGGAGFIGSHLTNHFLANGDSVFSVDNFSTGHPMNIEKFKNNPHFTFHLGQAEDPTLITPLVESCDVIFHLAASVGVKTIVENPIESIENNLHATGLLLRLASLYKKRIFTFSTSEVYGKSPKFPFEEQDDVVLGPFNKLRWSYAASKLIDDYLARAYSTHRGLEVTIVRLFNTIGQGQLGRYGMVVPRFFQQAMSNAPITVYGSGQQTRCFSDVRDVVQAIASLVHVQKSHGELVNIGTDQEISINTLAKEIVKITNSSSQIINITFEQAYGEEFEDMNRRVPSCQKLKSLSGYEFKYKLSDTLSWIHQGFSEKLAASVQANTDKNEIGLTI